MQLPQVCSYQQVQYIIIVTNTSLEIAFQTGPQVQLYGLGETIDWQTEGLDQGLYTIEATFDVLGVEEDSHLSANLTVGELIIILCLHINFRREGGGTTFI